MHREQDGEASKEMMQSEEYTSDGKLDRLEAILQQDVTSNPIGLLLAALFMRKFMQLSLNLRREEAALREQKRAEEIAEIKYNQMRAKAASPNDAVSQEIAAEVLTGVLPAKKQDLTRYLDATRLTPRQRECFSLKFEYELTDEQIAKRLGLHRKTVYEHIAACRRRMEKADVHEKMRREISKRNPSK